MGASLRPTSKKANREGGASAALPSPHQQCAVYCSRPELPTAASAGDATDTPRTTLPGPAMIFGSPTPSPLQSKPPPLSITRFLAPTSTRTFAPVVASKIALGLRPFPSILLPRNVLLHAHWTKSAALPAPVTWLFPKALWVMRTAPNRTPYTVAPARRLLSKWLPARLVVAIEFPHGPRTMLSATTTSLPSRTRIPPKNSPPDGAVATTVLRSTREPSIPVCMWMPVDDPADAKLLSATTAFLVPTKNAHSPSGLPHVTLLLVNRAVSAKNPKVPSVPAT